MTVCGHGFHSGLMAYMLQFGRLKCYSHNFCGVGSICEAIFSWLNLRPEDEFLHFFTIEWNCLHHGWVLCLWFFCLFVWFFLFLLALSK